MTLDTVAYLLIAFAIVLGAVSLTLVGLHRTTTMPKGAVQAAMLPRNPDKQVLMAVVLVAIISMLGLAYVLREPSRLAEATARQTEMSIEKGARTYAALCVSCHGLRGEGGVGKPLNVAQFRQGSQQELDKAAELLRKTINRGRYGTAMPAWAMEDGGPLNAEQVNQLVVLIQHGDWEEVAKHTSAAPAQAAPAPGTTGATAPDAAHPGVGDLAAEGKQVYSAKGCPACHGATLQGGVGPALQHFGMKTDIAGVAPLNAENIKKWLADPGAMKRFTAMPKLGLRDREIEALVAYLMQQE